VVLGQFFLIQNHIFFSIFLCLIQSKQVVFTYIDVFLCNFVIWMWHCVICVLCGIVWFFVLLRCLFGFYWIRRYEYSDHFNFVILFVGNLALYVIISLFSSKKFRFFFYFWPYHLHLIKLIILLNFKYYFCFYQLIVVLILSQFLFLFLIFLFERLFLKFCIAV